jgi:hypothetical protein
MTASYTNLIFKIIVTILFVCLFTKLSYCNSKIIRFKSFYINSALWMFVIVLSIFIFREYDKYTGTLLFILIATHYKKFGKDPFALREFFQSEYIHTGNLPYISSPTRIGHTLSLYPPTTTSPN